MAPRTSKSSSPPSRSSSRAEAAGKGGKASKAGMQTSRAQSEPASSGRGGSTRASQGGEKKSTGSKSSK